MMTVEEDTRIIELTFNKKEKVECIKKGLEQIKKEEREKGREDIKDYILFCGQNFPHGGIKGLESVLMFFEEIADFINGSSLGIANKYGYTFEEFVRRFRP